MGFRMRDVPVATVPGVVIETYGQRQNAPGDDIRIHQIVDVGVGIALESLQDEEPGRRRGGAVPEHHP